jgi:hypothetical protein
MIRRISRFGEKLHLELKMSRTVCLEVRGRRVSAAFAQLFHDPAGLVWKNWFLLYKLFVSMRFSTAGGAVNESKAQFTKDGKKTAAYTIERELTRLQQRMRAFAHQLGDSVQIEIPNQQGQFRLFRWLLNHDDWRIARRSL